MERRTNALLALLESAINVLAMEPLFSPFLGGIVMIIRFSTEKMYQRKQKKQNAKHDVRQVSCCVFSGATGADCLDTGLIFTFNWTRRKINVGHLSQLRHSH